MPQALIDEIVKNKKPVTHRLQQLEDNMAIIAESDLATENINLNWSVIVVRAQGFTVSDTDPLEVERLDEIVISIEGMQDTPGCTCLGLTAWFTEKL